MSFPRIEGYVVTEKIGSGSYSTVYKAYNKVGGRQTVAVKCVEAARVKQSGAAVDNLVTEIRLLKTLTHAHIVRMHDFTWDDRYIYIIMEYCNAGDLSKYIRKYGRVPEAQVRYFLQQLAAALKYLHERGVVHMDLKPHNLLLHKGSDGRLTLKVADFGFAAHLHSAEGAGLRGSPLYMAPEMLAGRASHVVDLWSVGVIMYECLFGRAPYASASLQELLDKIQRKEPIQIPSKCAVSAETRALLEALLQHEPAQRISYEAFFAHPYLDLEHMPSAHNYQKAVGLIHAAVCAESAGALGEALEHYTEGLRYLVPCAGAEGDAARRAALRHKLTSYMERAEEIKRVLKGGPPPQPSARPQRALHGTGGARSDTLQEPPEQEPPESGGEGRAGGGEGEEGARGDVAGGSHGEGAGGAHGEGARVSRGEGARGVLRRLLGMRPPPPLLHPADCTMGGGAAPPADDACRIT